MKKNILIAFLIITTISIVGFMVSGTNLSQVSDSNSISVQEKGLLATVYKSPSCGCCGVYATYMKKEGYVVQIEDIRDMSLVKEKFSVPYELESCHTTEIDGYVVEGHIPEEAIQKLLAEKPDIKGIGMPGMPSGSPGMPGPKNEEFVIYEITHEGQRGDIFMTI